VILSQIEALKFIRFSKSTLKGTSRVKVCTGMTDVFMVMQNILLDKEAEGAKQ
jgi:hypothetical protein